MSIAPCRGSALILRGLFAFSAKPKGSQVEIIDSFEIEITVPSSFPRRVPTVIELDGKIPWELDYHVFIRDGTLCLGSPVRLLKMVSERPTLVGFAESCLVPYLYGVSFKLRFGGSFVLGELAHNRQAVIEDYVELFGLTDGGQVIESLTLLGMKRRHANKMQCPCGCGMRLGKCAFHRRLNTFRYIGNRSWYSGHANLLVAKLQDRDLEKRR